MKADLSNPHSVTAVILAGGRGRRMGEKEKGLLELQGQALAGHVAQRIAPQVQRILINANSQSEHYRALGHEVVPDVVADRPGPLAGIVTALEAAETERVLIVPCDTPRLPPDLVRRLGAAMDASGADLAVAGDGRRLHPTVLLLNRGRLAQSARNALDRGERRLESWVLGEGAAVADFSDCPEALTNVNTPEQLQALEHWRPVIGFVAPSGTGKTTLLERVVQELRGRGVRVAVVKHTHHRFDIDRPGKDSYRMREAGAAQVMVASRRRWAIMTELDEEVPEPRLGELLPQLDPSRFELVLVEGFKHESFPKIELHRPSLGHTALYPDDTDIIAVATDEPAAVDADRTLLNINNPAEVARFVMDFMAGAHTRKPPTKGREK